MCSDGAVSRSFLKDSAAQGAVPFQRGQAITLHADKPGRYLTTKFFTTYPLRTITSAL